MMCRGLRVCVLALAGAGAVVRADAPTGGPDLTPPGREEAAWAKAAISWSWVVQDPFGSWTFASDGQTAGMRNYVMPESPTVAFDRLPGPGRPFRVGLEGLPTAADVRSLSRFEQRHALYLRYPPSGLAEVHPLTALASLRQLGLHGGGRKALRLSALEKLERLEALTLQRVDLAGEGLRHLPSLRQLSSLTLSNSVVWKDDLAQVARCRRLRQFRLWFCTVTAADLGCLAPEAQTGVPGGSVDPPREAVAIRAAQPPLETLALVAAGLGDEELRHVAAFTGLTCVSISAQPGCHDAGLARLAARKSRGA